MGPRTFATFAPATLMLVMGCGVGGGRGDRFVESDTSDRGAVARWVELDAGNLRVPLPAPLHWSEPLPIDPKLGAMLKVRAEEGPTFLVVSRVTGVTSGEGLDRCADLSRARLVAATEAAGVTSTPPRLTKEKHHGQDRPRLDYAIPLEAKEGARPASTLTAQTFVPLHDGCASIAVTSVVRASASDEKKPDPDDLDRFGRIVSIVFDGIETR